MCKINNFSVVTSIYPKYHAHNQVVPKTIVDKFSLREIKIENLNYLIRVKPNFGLVFFLTLLSKFLKF